MKDQQSFESPAQPGYNQHHCQREAEREEAGGQGFSSNDTTKGETQMYNVQGHTEKEENILKVEYKTTAFEKRYNTESISLQHQGSDCRNLETSDDNLTQEQAEQQGKTREDANHYEAMRQHDTTDASFVSAQISFVDSKINASKTDAKKKPIKDNSNEERLDGVWRQHDTRSSSPHRSRLESNSSPPLNNQDISENRRSTDYTAMKPSNKEETIEEASGSQIPIPMRENTSDQVKRRQQKQDSTNDKPLHVKEDYRTKVRNLARNRRKNAAERNKKRQEEVTRLVKANFDLKEKNQELINELATLGVDVMTIQLFLNSAYSENQRPVC